jgi:quercetin dioxygenase-like cupin family protein
MKRLEHGDGRPPVASRVCYKPLAFKAIVGWRGFMRKAKRTLGWIGLFVATVGILLVTGKQIQGISFTLETPLAAQMAKAKGTTDGSGVMFFAHEEISPAFKQNLMLYDGVPERNYRIAVFHRDKGGEVEIHKKDTDVFYILEGAATFVTGGTMVSGKESAPDEVRGLTMEGGAERKVGKGDVIVVPANVTHWYKEVQEPITYFGVKVR